MLAGKGWDDGFLFEVHEDIEMAAAELIVAMKNQSLCEFSLPVVDLCGVWEISVRLLQIVPEIELTDCGQ